MTVLPGVLAHHRILPVVVIDDPGMAVDAVAALAAGGIGAAEITLRTEAGLPSIAAVSAAGYLVGAGTVLTPGDVDRVADAGARFIATPGLDREVVERALGRGLDVLPGAATATEVQAALRCGLGAVKLFPADRLGGLDLISALAGPFPAVGFVPSGGVSPANLVPYLTHPNVPAVSGSWMVSRELLRAGDLAAIELLSREAAQLAAG
jgi:2-dehydro-3-deoxyphosphogluconate aldolase/(4S)-4-hydroxy-2-oxoglutarate aldolase